MVARLFLVRHKNSCFPVVYETEDGLDILKFQLYSLTSVSPDNQKIYGEKNRVISNDADLETIGEELRLVSLGEDGKEEAFASASDAAAIVRSDEEFARMLQAEEEANFQVFRAGEDGAVFGEDPIIFEDLLHEDDRQEAAQKTFLVDEFGEEASVSLAEENSRSLLEEALAAQANIEVEKARLLDNFAASGMAHAAERRQAQEALAKARAEAESARQEAAIAHKELSRAKVALAKSQAEVDAARASQAATSSSLENARSKLEEALVAQTNFQAEKARLLDNLAASRMAHAAKRSQAQEALAKAQAEAESARKEAAIAHEELNRVREALAKGQGEVDAAWASQAAATSSSLENARSQLEEALVAQANFQAEKARLEDEFAASRMAHAAERSQAQEALAKAQAEAESAQKEAVLAHEELSRAKEALVKAQAEADEARASQAAASSSLLATTSQSGTDVDPAQEIARLTSENNALKSQLLDMKAERFKESQVHAERLEKVCQEHAAILENERARRYRLRDQIRGQGISLSPTQDPARTRQVPAGSSQ